MNKAILKLMLTSVTVLASAGPAAATMKYFSYEASFKAIVSAVDTKLKGYPGRPLPHIDRDAYTGKLNGNFQIRIDGYFDTNYVTAVNFGQQAPVSFSIYQTNLFGTLTGGSYASLTKFDNGNIILSLKHNLAMVDPFNPATYTKVYNDTIITSKSTGDHNTNTANNLFQNGTYFLYGENFANIYGFRKTVFDYDSTSAEEYIGHGADVAKGTTRSDFFDGGTFTISDFDTSAAAVPEPLTWVLMFVGFGMVGIIARRRRTAALSA